MKKEDHETLFWVFHHTPVPELIGQQMERARKLVVNQRGEFHVEWHLAGDIKTLKCLFNCNKGDNLKSPCLYCMNAANVLDKKWWPKSPNRHLKDGNLQPVFPIPLVNVHICTLHALCRIIEKLVHLYIGFAWKILDVAERKEAILSLERVLSDIGLHGGNVRILKDMKKSTNEKDVPMKPSISGLKARRFLSKPIHLVRQKKTKTGKVYTSNYISKIHYEQWKRVHNAIKDHESRSKNSKAEVWRSVDVLFRMCETIFTNNLAIFGTSIKEAWTDLAITHYIVIIYPP